MGSREYVAVRDVPARAPDDLMFLKGDRITLLDATVPDRWLGVCEGVQGYFYPDDVQTDDAAAASVPSPRRKRSSRTKKGGARDGDVAESSPTMDANDANDSDKARRSPTKKKKKKKKGTQQVSAADSPAATDAGGSAGANAHSKSDAEVSTEPLKGLSVEASLSSFSITSPPPPPAAPVPAAPSGKAPITKRSSAGRLRVHVPSHVTAAESDSPLDTPMRSRRTRSHSSAPRVGVAARVPAELSLPLPQTPVLTSAAPLAAASPDAEAAAASTPEPDKDEDDEDEPVVQLRARPTRDRASRVLTFAPMHTELLDTSVEPLADSDGPRAPPPVPITEAHRQYSRSVDAVAELAGGSDGSLVRRRAVRTRSRSSSVGVASGPTTPPKALPPLRESASEPPRVRFAGVPQSPATPMSVPPQASLTSRAVAPPSPSPTAADSPRLAPHSFAPVGFMSMATLSSLSPVRKGSVCLVCREPIRGVRHVHRCAACHELCHSHCAALAPASCVPKGSKARRALALTPTNEGGNAASKVFGVRLVDLCEREGTTVPAIVSECVAAIDQRGLSEEGIFRVGGTATTIESLKQAFDSGKANLADRQWADINVVASLLKSYMRTLPEPLVPFELYHDLINALDLKTLDERVVVYKLLLPRMDMAHYDTLRCVCALLHRVQLNVEKNRMSISNLAMVLGPTMLRSPEGRDLLELHSQSKVLNFLITHFSDLFA